MIAIGTPMVSLTGFAGYATGRRGAPGGAIEIVTTIDHPPERRWFHEDHMSSHIAPDPVAVGRKVPCHGQNWSGS